LKIAILGTRGIPNNYGGFEQFAEYLGEGLVRKGHQVTVYNPSLHPYKNKAYKGINIITKYSPENRIGSLANFYYDWICSLDASKRDFDIVYHAGYQSAAPGIKYFSSKSNSIWLTNMDGIEWKRDKWSKPIKWLTKIMEKIAIKNSDYLISDNIGIQKYYKDIHDADSFFLAYGANIPKVENMSILDLYNLADYDFSLIIARLEPENSIEIILEGYSLSNTNEKLLVVGNHNTKYGKYLKNKFSQFGYIKFVGGIYNKEYLDSLRKYSKFYFHGHTVGGTNPSLLEAMAVGANIIAHDNLFNKSVLQGKAQFFTKTDDLVSLINESKDKDFSNYRNSVQEIIRDKYSWDKVISQHIELFEKILN
jgi:hypothetical protein